MRIATSIAGTEARGFTLLELLVVLVIAGLAASLVGPAFQRLMPGLQLETETRELVAMLRHARSQAILSGKLVTVSQDAESGGLRLSYREGLHKPPGGLTLTLASGSESAALAAAGTTLAGGTMIRFFPEGDSSGGSLTVAAEDGRQALIKIEGLSGRVLRTSAEEEERLASEREAQKAKAQRRLKMHRSSSKESSFGRQEQGNGPT